MTQSERSAVNIVHTAIINLLLIYKAVENRLYNINEASYWAYLIVNSFMAVNQGRDRIKAQVISCNMLDSWFVTSYGAD